MTVHLSYAFFCIFTRGSLLLSIIIVIIIIIIIIIWGTTKAAVELRERSRARPSENGMTGYLCHRGGFAF